MKKTVSYLLIVMLALVLVFSMSSVAFAAEDVKMKVTISPSSIAKEGPVTVTVSIVNNGDASATGISLTYPQPTGNVIDMSDLAPGATGEHKNSSWNISEDMLGKDLVFTLKYTGVNSDGAAVQKTMTAPVKIEKKAEEVKVSAKDSVDKKTAAKDEKVNFAFDLKNEGTAKLENVKLVAPPIEGGSQLGETFTLEPGATRKMTYTINIKESMEVKPVFTYTALGKEGKTALEPLKVTVEGSKPSASPSAGAGLIAVLFSDDASVAVAPGDDVVFNVDINNAGSSKVTDLVAKDSKGNSVSLDKTSLEAGESAVGSATIKVDATGNFKFDITAKDSSGNPISIASNSVEIKTAVVPSPTASVDPKKALKLTIGVSTASLKKPGTVEFTVSVNNNSKDTLSNIVISEATLGTIGTLAQLSAGADETFPVKTAEVTKTTDYTFKAVAEMPDGSIITNTVQNVKIKVENASSGAGNMNVVLIIIIAAIVVVAVLLVLYLLKQKKKGKPVAMGNKSSSINKNDRQRPPYGSQRETPRGKPRETEKIVGRETTVNQQRNDIPYDQRASNGRLSAEARREQEYNNKLNQTQRVPKQRPEIYDIEPQEMSNERQYVEQPRAAAPQQKQEVPQQGQAAPQQRQATPQQGNQQNNGMQEPRQQGSRRSLNVEEPKQVKPVKKDRNNF